MNSASSPASVAQSGGERARLPDYAVIGWPLDRTYSPAMHQAALAGASLAAEYGAIPVPPAHLALFLRNAAAAGMCGVNVTMPHKQAAAGLCDRLDSLAAACGAVNTIRFAPPGAMDGYNTDGPGLLAALRHKTGFAPQGGQVVIIGAGGSACAAAAALAGGGAARITVVNRTPETAAALCSHLGRAFPATEWQARPLANPGPAMPADLVLACVPPAAADVAAPILEAAPPGAVFMDLSYGPEPSSLHRTAQAAGLRAVAGLEMLLWQGVLAFQLLTGVDDAATPDRMRRALKCVAGEWWRC